MLQRRVAVAAACGAAVALAAGAVAGGAARAAAPAAATQPMPAAWLKACRASKAAPACPARSQRSKLWGDPEFQLPTRVHTALGATSFILYADARYGFDEPVCVGEYDGKQMDYSRLTAACHARFAPAKGLVVWASITAGPILSTVHVEWRTRKLQPARVADGVAARHGAIPLDFGPVTWGGRQGRLLLGPHPFSEELVFVWGQGAQQRGVGIQVFEPLTQAVATLQAMVASVPGA